MANLKNLLGAMLCDIVKARVEADLCTRDLSRIYEQDPILSEFPVPLIDLAELELDLKFAVRDLEQQRTSDQEARIDRCIELHTAKLAEQVVSEIYQFIECHDERELDQISRQALFDLLSGDYLRNQLRVRTADMIKSSRTEWISRDLELDVSAVQEVVTKTLRMLLQRLLTMSELTSESTGILEELLRISEDHLRARLLELADCIRSIPSEQSEFDLEVEARTDRLKELPQEAISTLKLKLSTRNMLWTKVGDEEGIVERKLLSE